MDLYDMTSRVLRQCRLDPTDADDRAEHQGWITETLNEAYRRICREKTPLEYTEAVTLDANKCFNISALSKTLNKIVKISAYQDYTEAASYDASAAMPWKKFDGAGTIIVPGATASSIVYVKYEYMPEDLKVTYNVSGANTDATIPITEALTAAQAAALADMTLHVIDVSAGTHTEYTVDSAAAGEAGATTITVAETIGTELAAGDTIYIGDEFTPAINESWHFIMTYWATAQYYLSKGAKYAGIANMWVGMFDRELGNISNDTGEAQVITGAYHPL